MKTVKYLTFALLATFGLAALAQQTNNPAPPLPGMTPGGQVDVVSLINLTILAITPIVTQGFKLLFPKLPSFTLNLLAPLLGAGAGALLNALGVEAATGWGAAIWGGLGTWLFELSKNTKDYLANIGNTPPTG